MMLVSGVVLILCWCFQLKINNSLLSCLYCSSLLTGGALVKGQSAQDWQTEILSFTFDTPGQAVLSTLALKAMSKHFSFINLIYSSWSWLYCLRLLYLYLFITYFIFIKPWHYWQCAMPSYFKSNNMIVIIIYNLVWIVLGFSCFSK